MQEKHFGPVWFIPGETQGKYPHCISVYVEEAGVLIDPASDRNRLIQLRENPGVKEIWLSHWHEDHIMHLDLFEDLPLVIPKIESPPLSDMEILLDWYDMDDPEIRALWRQLMIDQFHFRPRVPARTFEGDEVVNLGSVTMEIIHTPGHTPGHSAFFFREPEVLFMGDYDLSKFGPYYGDRDSSIEDTIASVQRLRSIPARVWITGHKPALFESEPAEAWDRYLGIIDERDRKLIEYLGQPRTIEEIVSQWIVYRKPQEPAFAERVMISKHLEKMLREGKIGKERDHYFLNQIG